MSPGLSCGVLQLWRGRIEFVKPCDRFVDVGFVEQFGTVEPITADRQNDDLPPLCVESFSRRPIRRMGYHRSEVAQSMHGRNVDTYIRRDVPRCTDVRD